MAREHIASLPEKTKQNIANMNYMVQNAMPYNPQTGRFDTGPTFSEFANYVPNLMGATAWHGSPHQFNKFNLAELGSGEGSQAFGHGIYLAENPSVAKGYQKALSGSMYTAQDLADYFKPGEIRRKTGGYDKVISFTPADPTNHKGWHTVVQEVFQNPSGEWVPHPTYGRPRAHATAPSEVEFAKAVGRELSPAGNLYKVDVPDEHIAKMLDWDVPLNKQPENVKKLFSEHGSEYDFEDWLRLPETADKLNQLGIPGIKYLDRASRFGNREAKTQNYVVFDPDKSTKILERNNEPIGPLSNLD